MKNFNTFVLNFLNEADKEKIIVDDNGVIQDKVNEKEFTNWLKKNLSKVKLVKNKKKFLSIYQLISNNYHTLHQY